MKLTTNDKKALQGAIRVLVEILQQAPPEVPERIEEWPVDDTHLRGEFWKCSWGSVISYRGDGWYWWDHRNHCWHPEDHPGEFPPLTRTADPTEVPDRVEQWPYEDEHLRGDFWKDPSGGVWRWVPSEEMWQVWSHEYREWAGKTSSLAWMSCTFTRTTDPSLPRTWDTPEVPEVVHEWPEQDEHLRECLWLDWTGNYFWIFEPVANNPRRWVKRRRFEGAYMGQDSQPQGGPWTRTTDPSLPRTWDSLDAVDADVERATGDYAGMRRELARSPLSESGWFQRIQDNTPRRWTELPETETNNVTNIKETP